MANSKKKPSTNPTGIKRVTLVSGLKATFPELFKKRTGGPRISAAALSMLSPTLRASVLTELKKAQGQEGVNYTPVEIGEWILSFGGLPSNK